MAALIAGVGAALASAQQAPSREEIGRMMATLGGPKPEHERLGALAGSWTVESVFHFGGEPLVVPGTAEGEWILGGRFLQLTTTPTPGDAVALEAVTMHGYDTRSGEYFIIAMDSLGTYAVTAQGGWDEGASTLRLHGENTENGQTMPFRWEMQVVDERTLSQRILFEDPAAPGAWRAIAETTFTRAD